jgi:hypothetical protein
VLGMRNCAAVRIPAQDASALTHGNAS